MKKLLLLTCILLPMLSHAQYIKGKIKDQQGEPIPYVLIYAEGTEYGTTASINGEFFLPVKHGQYSFKAQSIGYQTVSKKISISGTDTLDWQINMPEQGMKINEVVVSAKDDPAKRIMKKVIKQKDFHAKQIANFESDVYLKAVARTTSAPEKILGQKIETSDLGLDTTGKGILFLVEQYATYYSKNNKEERTVIHSVKQSGNPNGLGFSNLPTVISFYKDNLPILSSANPRGFISPLNSNAFLYYNFKLLGTFLDDNTTIYKISVTPKRSYEPCFIGEIYVVDDVWALHSVNLELNKSTSLNFFDTLRVRQQYIPMKKNLWSIKQQILDPRINIFGFGAQFSALSQYSNQKINQPLPDSLFNQKFATIYDSDALKKDSAYWQESRPFVLEEDESRNYIKMDSTYLAVNDPKYIDSIERKANKFKIGSWFLGPYNYNSTRHQLQYRLNAVTDMIAYNTVEGLMVHPEVSFDKGLDSQNRLVGAAFMRYGFNNTHFNALGRLRWVHQDRKHSGKGYSIGINGGKYVYEFTEFMMIPSFFNTTSSLLYGKNHLKIYERWQAGLSYRKALGNGLVIATNLQFQKRIPLENTTDFTFAKTDYFTPNLPKVPGAAQWQTHNALLWKAELIYRPGVSYIKYPEKIEMQYSPLYPEFNLSYQKGINGMMNSDVDFDRLELNIKGNLKMRLLGNLQYDLLGGGFLNSKKMGLMDLKHYNANEFQLFVKQPKVFQVMPYYEFSHASKGYIEAHAEWQLLGLLTNKIPGFRNLQWYLVTGANATYNADKQYYAEAFVGLDNIGFKLVRILRVDAIKGWDHLKRDYFAIRASFSTSGVIRFGSKDPVTEF